LRYRDFKDWKVGGEFISELLCVGVGVGSLVFRVNQHPLDHETLREEDFRRRPHFDASGYPYPAIDIGLSTSIGEP